ncbi:glutathione S-transferase family protein [Ectopseudomonas mendocina]|uniref:Glutathione S-transferase family protein n=1 Tax=Ectopseudomonas mendocina TaxID=300 RepID=A0ABZ2RDM2_ECTME
MSLTVYGAPLSPFVRKVRLLLAEKGLDYQLEIVLPFNQPAWFSELSPLGRIPALRDGDTTLADSSVICQYIEDKYPQSLQLLGDTPEERAKVRWIEKYADYEVAPLSTFAVFRNRIVLPSIGQQCDEDAAQKALTQKLPPHFDYLEKLLGDADYFVGGKLTLADLAVATQLVNLQHANEQLDAHRWPKLHAHFERIKARETAASMIASEQKVIAKMTGK